MIQVFRWVFVALPRVAEKHGQALFTGEWAWENRCCGWSCWGATIPRYSFDFLQSTHFNIFCSFKNHCVNFCKSCLWQTVPVQKFKTTRMFSSVKHNRKALNRINQLASALVNGFFQLKWTLLHLYKVDVRKKWLYSLLNLNTIFRKT